MNQINYPEQTTYYIIYDDNEYPPHIGWVDPNQVMETLLKNMETFIVESDWQNRLLNYFRILYTSNVTYWINYNDDKSLVDWGVNQPWIQQDLQYNNDLFYYDEQEWKDSLKNNFNIDEL
jgi:hypothetical protein